MTHLKEDSTLNKLKVFYFNNRCRDCPITKSAHKELFCNNKMSFIKYFVPLEIRISCDDDKISCFIKNRLA